MKPRVSQVASFYVKWETMQTGSSLPVIAEVGYGRVNCYCLPTLVFVV